MATVKRELNPQAGMFRTTAFPQIVQANGTNYPVAGLAFDAASDEHVYFKLEAADYGSGNLTVGLFWYADTASTNTCVWGAAIAAISANTDTQDIETDAFATANTVSDAHLGTTGQRLHYAEIAISNLDSIAADDFVTLDLYRDADNGSDNMTGDAILVGITLSYSDT